MVQAEQSNRELGLLTEIERDPDITQAGLATKLGVAVGTVNWHLKRLTAKGYVKVKRAERKKLRYIITPEGLALRARLTMAYIENSMKLYRQVREEARRILSTAKREKISAVRIVGDGDIADICRLTCLELGIQVVDGQSKDNELIVIVEGREINIIDKQAGEIGIPHPGNHITQEV
ncbi:MAG: winged helix-turn-helix transcriptional regulator [Anaerolineales bacterium]|nr:winged helix-turn-helix transcriptional regulator [Anaerolineales bacterium]